MWRIQMLVLVLGSMLLLPGSVRAAPAETKPCLLRPNDPNCASFEYGDEAALESVQAVCTTNSALPACSLFTSCQAGDMDGRVCQPFVLLATLCKAEPYQVICGLYNSMCAAGSVIKQCYEQAPIPFTPSWAASMNHVFQICSAMSMRQCTSCTSASCEDPLATVSAMCLEMPMRGCEDYYAWCSENGGDSGAFAWYCGGGSARAKVSSEGGLGSSRRGSADLLGENLLPPTMIYFHQRLNEVILFKEWIPETNGQYVGAIFAVLFMGIISTALKTVRSLITVHHLEQLRRMGAKNPVQVHIEAGRPVWMPVSMLQVVATLKAAAVSGPSIMLDYFCMLVAMTFNIGLFTAVIMGYAIGTLLFHHLPDNYHDMLKAQAPGSKYLVQVGASADDKTSSQGSGDPKDVERASTQQTMVSRGADIEAGPSSADSRSATGSIASPTASSGSDEYAGNYTYRNTVVGGTAGACCD